MNLSVENVNSAEEIGEIMREMVERYHRDMMPFYCLSVLEVYNYIKELPYRLEDGAFQILSRPAYCIHGLAPFVACANKSIMLASYMELKGIPYRFVLCNHKKGDQLDHVFLEILTKNKKWLKIDPTYSRYSLIAGPEPYVDSVRV